METQTIVIITIFQYIAVLCGWFVYIQLPKYWFNVRTLTWMLMMIPVIGLAYGSVKFLISAIKK